jgi:rhodanese-related sulfurtransferase
MRNFREIIAVLGCLLFGFPALASKDTPVELPGVTILSLEAVQHLVGQPDVRIYDLRKKASYVEGRIPGAISIARYYDAAAEKLDTSFLGADYNRPIIFYSHGVAGWKSYWAAKAAIRAGYRNVMWFRGGYADWEDRGLPIER